MKISKFYPHQTTKRKIRYTTLQLTVSNRKFLKLNTKNKILFHIRIHQLKIHHHNTNRAPNRRIARHIPPIWAPTPPTPNSKSFTIREILSICRNTKGQRGPKNKNESREARETRHTGDIKQRRRG